MNSIELNESAFSASIRKFLVSVECKAPRDLSELERIYRMRYASYSREGALPPGAPEIFKDRYDESPNGRTYALYVNRQLSSTIRLHVAGPDQPEMPAETVFRDQLDPLLAAGATIIDPTRFVSEETAARLYPKLPYVTVRVGWMACEYFNADYVLATVRAEHQSFYKRLFGHKVLCEPRPYPSLAKPISLMILDYRATRAAVMTRYPFLRSTEDERRKIFDGSDVDTP
jgi:hypothetical protein